MSVWKTAKAAKLYHKSLFFFLGADKDKLQKFDPYKQEPLSDSESVVSVELIVFGL